MTGPMDEHPAPAGSPRDAGPVEYRPLHLYTWRSPAIVAVALVAMAAGFGQFGAVAALGDVARHFGRVTTGASLTDQAGLSGTELGVGLAVLASRRSGRSPLAGLADRFGRRRILLWCCGAGLALTVLAAGSPSYWWFVAIFALGRPLLSSSTAVAQVVAAEETSSTERAKAVALIAAGYGIGAGLTAILHGLAHARAAASAACSCSRWCPSPCCRCSAGASSRATASRSPPPHPSTGCPCSGRSARGSAGASRSSHSSPSPSRS